MALIKCKECGNEVSKKAKECPQYDAVAKRGVSTGAGCLLITLVAVVGLTIGIIVANSGGGGQTQSPKRAVPRDVDALARMEVAFVGNPSRSQIKLLLDRTFSLYGVPKIEDNYMRIGSVLVRMRQETAIPEMTILEQTRIQHVPGVSMKLPGAIALATSELEVRRQ